MAPRKTKGVSVKPAWVVTAAIVAGLLFGLLTPRTNSEHPNAQLYRQLEERGISGAIVFGSFFLLGAIAVAVQTIIGQRRGWAYCGRTARAYRDQDPKRYHFWLGVQWFFVVMLAALAIVFFAGIAGSP